MITVLYVEDLDSARAEIADAGGRVMHVLTGSAIVADVPPGVDLNASTADPPADLDPLSARAVEAWTAARSKPATEAIPWDSPGFEAPG